MSIVTNYDQILSDICITINKIESSILSNDLNFTINDIELLKTEIQRNNLNELFIFLEKYSNNDQLNQIYEFKKLFRLINDLNESKNNPQIVEIWDDFLTGHCHEFAISLNQLFGYKLGIITGKSKDPFGNELTHLFHAFSIDKNGKAFDIEGTYSIESAVKGYKSMQNPKTGNIAYDIEFKTFNSISAFKENIFNLPVDQLFINQGIKRITKNPLVYFDTISIKENEDLILKTNENYQLSSENFYQYKNKNRLFETMSINIKKEFNPIKNIWIFNNVHSVFNGIRINLGLGSYEFDLISINLNINQEINEDLTDEESIHNINLYFSKITNNIINQKYINIK